MAVTDAQQKSLILLEIGDNDDNSPVAQNIDFLWDLYADKAKQYPRLQYLYCLTKCIDIWMGQSWKGGFHKVDTQQKALDDKKTYLQGMRDNAQAEIEKLEKRSAASRAPSVGSMTQTAPVMPSSLPATTGMPDPNDRRFRGDPLLPSTDTTRGTF